MLAFICAIASVRDLGAPDTPIRSIENLRFNTRSPSGWLLLVILIALPLEIFILIVRFLNFPIVNKYSTIFLTVVSYMSLNVFRCGCGIVVSILNHIIIVCMTYKAKKCKVYIVSDNLLC